MVTAKMAWHYTIGLYADSIRDSGELRPATAGVPAGETPVVWFSTRQLWEPTANKGCIDSAGHRIGLTFKQTVEHGGGGWRFGVPSDELIPWKRLIDEARIAPDFARGLVKSAQRSGADPAFWYGSLQSVLIARCLIERLDGESWTRV
jgi:hypothetical protein